VWICSAPRESTLSCFPSRSPPPCYHLEAFCGGEQGEEMAAAAAALTNLGDADGLQTRLSPAAEVTRDLDGVRRAAQVGVDPVHALQVDDTHTHTHGVRPRCVCVCVCVCVCTDAAVRSPSCGLCSHSCRSRQIRTGLARFPRGFFRLWTRVLRCCRVLKISVPWSNMGVSTCWYFYIGHEITC